MKLRRDEYLYVRSPSRLLVRVTAIYGTVSAANAHLVDHPNHMVAAVFESMIVLGRAGDGGIHPPPELLRKPKPKRKRKS